MSRTEITRRLASFARYLVQATLASTLISASWPALAAAQVAASVSPNPPIVYVSNGGGGITEINAANNSVIATAPFPNNANGVVVSPDGRRIYAANRDIGQVTVFDAATNVPLQVISVGNGNDNLGLAISPDGSLVYVANQVSGTVTVIATATNTVVQIIPTGFEPIWITFSADGSRAYVSNQASGSVSVISTASGSVINTIFGFACPFESIVTRDTSKLLVSSQCDSSLKVVDLASNSIVNVIPTGPNPRGIALTPDGTRAYVADWFSNTVDVIDVAAQKNLNTPIIVGSNPWGMAMTPGGVAYVANFGGNTISVINTATNTVVATLPSRGNPEDVTVSSTARPRILGYSFQAFDPPGSVDTLPHAINTRGQNVGRFQDAAGAIHGYLRQVDGSFVTIDAPGSTFTSAVGINDLGTIVGVWRAFDGAFHAFTRSPSGSYNVTDFPGAVDSEFSSINSQGALLGNYDLGDITTSIGFLDTRGSFTSFENPAAASMRTTALAVNSQNFVTGFFDDPAGNEHSFVRTPNAQFENFDFPIANFTDSYAINDLGQAVGQYATNFPNHGFVLSGATGLTGLPSPCQFLSFDYPDSQMSGARGINNASQITGIYLLSGSPARHGFLATPGAGATSGQNNQCSNTGVFPKHGADFKSFDFPGSTNTQATAITPSGVIVGRYNSADGVQHGFSLRNGSFSSIDAPGASSTDAAWINARGDVVGSFSDARGGHAYVLSNGSFKTIDFPSATPVNITGFGISNAGDVVGVEFIGGDFSHGHGYLFSKNAFTLIDFPGALGTFPTMIIDSTRIVGAYVDSNSLLHGFSVSNGKFSTIDVPGSAFTWITGINPEGDIVGFYNDQTQRQHAFVQHNGSFITIDVPAATLTEGNGIDPQGDLVGRYVSADGNTHAYFLRCAACGHLDPTRFSKSSQ